LIKCYEKILVTFIHALLTFFCCSVLGVGKEPITMNRTISLSIFPFMFIVVGYMLVASKFLQLYILNVSQSISDGKTFVSSRGVFEHNFFSPGNSKNHYLGIWYENIPTDRVFWVANRANSINDSSDYLTFNSRGNPELRQHDTVVWYTNITIYHSGAQNPDGTS